LIVWGLIDQGNSYYQYINHDSEHRSNRPGIFQASITGVGGLVVYVNHDVIAGLRINRLIRGTFDALREGPIHRALQPGLKAFKRAVRAAPGGAGMVRFENEIAERWLNSISRLLLRIQSYGHGGAILFAPRMHSEGLTLQYELNYSRLQTSLKKYAGLLVDAYEAREVIWKAEKIYDSDVDTLRGMENQLNECHLEVDSAIWFISLLSRVDGAVLIDSDLNVRAFGVEITKEATPMRIRKAGDANATPDKLTEISFSSFGTRHRSMMRFCSVVKSSIGFVVSQDGDVRAMTKVNGQLVVWENIRLQLPIYVRRKRPS
jgi:hypothetical protein